MSTSTRRKVNKEWGIEEERYSRTAPGFTKRKLRKRDTLPIIFVIAMLAVLAIGGWRSSAMAGEPIAVTFNANAGYWISDADGSHINSLEIMSTPTIDEGDDAGKASVNFPEAPLRPGYGFDKWYIRESESLRAFDVSEKIDEEITLYAGWDALQIVAPEPYVEGINISSLHYGDTDGVLSVEFDEADYHTYSYCRECTNDDNDSVYP